MQVYLITQSSLKILDLGIALENFHVNTRIVYFTSAMTTFQPT